MRRSDDSNPLATFVRTEPTELGDAAASGEATDVLALRRVHDQRVTNTVEIPLQPSSHTAWSW